MNAPHSTPQDPYLRIEHDLSNLAAEYALGRLHGKDRERFEMLMAVNPALKTFVRKWSGILGTLAPTPVVAPEPLPVAGSLWERLEHRLNAEEKVMGTLHEHQFSVRTSLAITIGALRVLRERLATLREQSHDRPHHASLLAEPATPSTH